MGKQRIKGLGVFNTIRIVLFILLLWSAFKTVVPMMFGGFAPSLVYRFIFVFTGLWIILSIRPLKLRLLGFFTQEISLCKKIFYPIFVLVALFLLTFYWHHLSYQRYLGKIFKYYISDPIPTTVKLIDGNHVAWLDLFVDLNFITDEETFKEISKDYEPIIGNLSGCYYFPSSKDATVYFYKEIEVSEGFYRAYYLSRNEYNKKTYLNVSNGQTSYVQIGEFLQRDGQYQAALDNYEKALENDSSSELGGGVFDVRYGLYAIMGEYEKAAEDLSTLIEMRDTYGLLLEGEYRADRADIYEWLGRYQAAADDYSRSLEILEGCIDEIAEGKKESGQRSCQDLSIDWEKYSANSGIGNQEYYEGEMTRFVMKRGNAYRKAGQYEKAISDFSAAIEGKLTDRMLGDCYFFRGLCYRALNEKEKMRSDWEKAQSLGDKLVDGTYNHWIDRTKYNVFKIKEGKFTWYYLNGNISFEVNYVNDKREGKYTSYYDNGAIKKIGYYKDGKKVK